MKNQYEIDYQQGYDNANEEWLNRMAEIRDCGAKMVKRSEKE